MLLLDLVLSRVVDGVMEGPSGSRWTVTCKSLMSVPDRDGRFEGCARFDGETSKITVAGIACPPRFTFAAWVRGGPLLAFHYSTIFGFGGDHPFFGLHRGRPILSNSVTAPDPIGRGWTHVAATQADDGTRLFVDGALVASSSSLAANHGVGLGIGCDLGRGYAWFEGDMARVSIFDEALSEVAVLGLARTPRAGVIRETQAIPIAPGEIARDPLEMPVLASVPVTIASAAREPTVIDGATSTVSSVAAEGPEISIAPSEISVSVTFSDEVPTLPVVAPSAAADIMEIVQIVSMVTVVATPPAFRWEAHHASLRALHEAFPCAALGHLVATLGARIAPSPAAGLRLGEWSPTGGGELFVDMDPFGIDAGGGAVVRLSGVEGRCPVLCLHLAPAEVGVAPRTLARLRGRMALLGGAISGDIDQDMAAGEGLRVTLRGGAFGESVETTLVLFSALRCEITFSTVFAYAAHVGPFALDLEVAAAFSVRVDGAKFRQHVVLSFEIAGERLVVEATPSDLVVSVEGLCHVFEEAARGTIEKRVAATRDNLLQNSVRLHRIGDATRQLAAPVMRLFGRR